MADTTAEPAAQEMPGEGTTEAAPLGAAHEPTEPGTALIQRAPLPQAVAPYVLSDDEIRRTWRVSSALAASGMFKDANQASQAFAKVLIGRDLGISPTQALQAIDLVKGSIQLRGVLLASFVRRSRDYEYRVPEHTHDKAVVQLLGFPCDEPYDGLVRHRGQWWEVLGTETFTVADAKRAGLIKSGGAWEAHPKNMCLWRAMSNAVKFHAPELLGGVPVYVEGEVVPDKALGEGEGDGQSVGLDLGPDVEAVIARATDLGHAGLADRATVEMQLGDQPPAKVVEWVKAANRELDAIPVDAEVVDSAPEAPEAVLRQEMAQAGEDKDAAQNAPQTPPVASEAGESAPDPERIEALKRRGADLLADAERLRDAGDERADEVFEEFERIAAEVEAASNVDQGSLGF